MLRVSKLALISLLWFGISLQAAEAEPDEEFASSTSSIDDFFDLPEGALQQYVPTIVDMYNDYQIALTTAYSMKDQALKFEFYYRDLVTEYPNIDSLLAQADQGKDFLMINALSPVVQFRNQVIEIIQIYESYERQISAISDQQQKQRLLAQRLNVVLSKYFSPRILYVHIVLSELYKALAGQSVSIGFDLNQAIKVFEYILRAIDSIGKDFIALVARQTESEINKAIHEHKENETLRIMLNAFDKNGKTAFIWACRNNYVDVVRTMLALNANSGYTLFDVNAQDLESGYTALMLACLMNNNNVFKELMQNSNIQNNLNIYDDKGLTVLMHACRSGHITLVKELLDVKKPKTQELLVDVNLQAQNGYTALMFACENNHFGIVQLLLGRGVNVLIRGTNRLFENAPFESAFTILRAQLVDPQTSDIDKAKIRSILNVFDALRPDLDARETSKTAEELKRAYVMMQQGNSDPLFSMLVREVVFHRKTLLDEVMVSANAKAMQEIFKTECIASILKFLRPKCLNKTELAILDNYPQVIQSQQQYVAKAKAMPRARADMVTNMSW